ncbi:mechanosensitive ion channel family protein [Neobacillus sp. 19]|uniref:mechanosensitive ion channel family protein n=1 Tax=Neobacillus sp. 19 TaxID=3394458 RepID=UPI003BF6FF15
MKIAIIKQVLQSNSAAFILSSLSILCINWLIKWASVSFTKRNGTLGYRFLPILTSITNWMTIYGLILVFLYCFYDTKWLFTRLYSQNGVGVTPFLLIVSFMIVTLAHHFIKLVITYVLSPLYQHYQLDKGRAYTVNQMIYYTVMIAALAVSLTSVGLDFTAVGAILGVLGIGIGFGMRNIAGNFVSGIIMLFERPFEVGDTIEMDDKIGRVEEIRLRSTIIRTVKEGVLIVPNQTFIEQVIKNRSDAEMMAAVNISVVYGTDPDKVVQLLQEAIEQIKPFSKGVLPKPEPEIRFINFLINGMEFFIEIPVLNFEIKEQVESHLRHAIMKVFLNHNILLASPASPPAPSRPEKSV